MSDDLLKKVKKTIEATGFPLELETATIARRLGWHDFQSVEYQDPHTDDRTVRSVFVRMKKTLAEDKKTARKMEKLQDVIIKSQK